MKEYTVKSVVCDYGVFENEEMLIICNSQANAQLIADILNVDSKHEIYGIKSNDFSLLARLVKNQSRNCIIENAEIK